MTRLLKYKLLRFHNRIKIEKEEDGFVSRSFLNTVIMISLMISLKEKPIKMF